MANIKKKSIADTNINGTLSHLDQLKKIQRESEEYSLKLKKQEFEHKEAINKWTQLAKEQDIFLKKLRTEEYLQGREKRLAKQSENDFKDKAAVQGISKLANTSAGDLGINLAISALTGGLINPVIAKNLKLATGAKYLASKATFGASKLWNSLGSDWKDRSNSALKNEAENSPSFRKLSDIYKTVTGIRSDLKKPMVEEKKKNGLMEFFDSLGGIAKLLLAAAAGLGLSSLLKGYAGEGWLGEAIEKILPNAIAGFLTGGIPGAILGAALGVILPKLTEKVDQFLQQMGFEAPSVSEWVTKNLPFAVAGLGIAGIKGALLGLGIGSIYNFLKEETDNFQDLSLKDASTGNVMLNGAIAGGAVGLNLGGIKGALVGALIGASAGAFWKMVSAFKEGDALGVITNGALGLGTLLMGTMGVFKTLKAAGKTLVNVVKMGWKGLKGAFDIAIKGIKGLYDIIKGLGPKLLNATKNTLNGIKNLAKPVVDVTRKVAPKVAKAVPKVAKTAPKAVKGVAKAGGLLTAADMAISGYNSYNKVKNSAAVKASEGFYDVMADDNMEYAKTIDDPNASWWEKTKAIAGLTFLNGAGNFMNLTMAKSAEWAEHNAEKEAKQRKAAAAQIQKPGVIADNQTNTVSTHPQTSPVFINSEDNIANKQLKILEQMNDRLLFQLEQQDNITVALTNYLNKDYDLMKELKDVKEGKTTNLTGVTNVGGGRTIQAR